MREKLPQHLIHKERPDYGAVPLEPWTAVEERRVGLRKKRQAYLAASVLRINGRISTAMDAAVERHWVNSPELSDELRGLIETSLYDSQRRRMDLNPTVLQRDDIDESDERLEKAKSGTATPYELLTLLMDYPKLGSLELAKLSHPLDAEATETMDSDVMFALGRLHADYIDEPGRYKTKTVLSDIPAMTVLRKQTVAELYAPDGLLQVVQRKAFLVRGDEEACADNDKYLGRLVRNADRHDELYEKVEAAYAQPYELPAWYESERKWLQPLATSYYAKLVDEAGASK